MPVVVGGAAGLAQVKAILQGSLDAVDGRFLKHHF
jgi:hypothetical protein